MCNFKLLQSILTDFSKIKTRADKELCLSHSKNLHMLHDKFNLVFSAEPSPHPPLYKQSNKVLWSNKREKLSLYCVDCVVGIDLNLLKFKVVSIDIFIYFILSCSFLRPKTEKKIVEQAFQHLFFVNTIFSFA